MSTPPPPKPKLDFFAGLLSYLVPGLGQVYQGRIGKGLLFLVCLYSLFFYGMWLGSFRNVYLPHSNRTQNVVTDMKVLGDIENRLHFAGQFFIGAAAWPALVQYATYDPDADKHPILGTWMRGPYEDPLNPNRNRMQEDLNALQREGDKRWDLGWVYTVIAGVLNILVIYDAVAGPAVREPAKSADRSPEKEPVAS